MKIGVSETTDLVDLRRLYEAAFGDTKEFIDYYFNNKVICEKVTIIKEDEKLVAMMHMNPFTVNFNQHHYQVSYFVAVATDQAYRNRGLMGKLMAYSLRMLFDSGEVFSLLMPIDSRIYERYGFGFIEDHLNFECDSASFTIDKGAYNCRIATDEDSGLLMNIYETFSETMDLSTHRDAFEFGKLFKELGTDNAQIILFQEGYMMTFYDHEVLSVREFIANSDQAFKEMIHYLQELSQGGKIIIYDHIRSRIKHFLPNIPENKVVLKPFMMARIINVEKFIAENIHLFEEITIKVIDGFIEENNQCYQIKSSKVCRIHEDVYDVIIDIKTLTQVAFGYIHEEEIEHLNATNHFSNKKLIMKPCKQRTHFFNEYV